MNEYCELAAAALWLSPSTPEEVVEANLADRWGCDLAQFSEIADALLMLTRPFPSVLREGETIQAFGRPTGDGSAWVAYVRRIIPPPAGG